MCRIIHKPWSAKHALLARNSSRPLFQNTLSSPEIARAHYISKHALLARNRSRPLFGRSKVTLLSPTLSTQTQAEKPKGRGRTVTPPHISDKCVRKTWFHSPPNSPPFIPRGRQITFSPEAPFSRAVKPQPLLHGAPTAPISQPPSSLMPETLSICRRALGRVPLTPCF